MDIGFQPFSAEPQAKFGVSGKKGQMGRKVNQFRITKTGMINKKMGATDGFQTTYPRKKMSSFHIEFDENLTDNSTKDEYEKKKKRLNQSRPPNIEGLEKSTEARISEIINNYAKEERGVGSAQFSSSSNCRNSEKKDTSLISVTPLNNRRQKITVTRPSSDSKARDLKTSSTEPDSREGNRYLRDPYIRGPLETIKKTEFSGIGQLRINTNQHISLGCVQRHDSVKSTKNLKKDYRLPAGIPPRIKPRGSLGHKTKPDLVYKMEGSGTGILDEFDHLDEQANSFKNKIKVSKRPISSAVQIDSLRNIQSDSKAPSESRSIYTTSVQDSPLQSIKTNAINPQFFDNLVRGNVIGEGSYGIVYTGLDRNTGKVYAVKEMKTEIDNPHIKFRESFKNEIHILSTLEHKNILKYYGYILENEKLKIITDYMAEGSLKNIIQEMGPIPLKLVKKYTRQLVEALKYIHCKGRTG